MMSAWMVDLAKELVVMGLTAILSFVGHYVARLARDVNAAFNRIRSFESRLETLERAFGARDGSQLHQASSREHTNTV